MAYAGQTIENPVSGEKITFIQTAADTDGELLEIELELTARRRRPGAHIHPEQEERFEVVEGTMAFRLGLRKIVAGPGEVVTVPAGRVHKFKNAGDETAKVRVQVRPALDMEQLFETTVALARGRPHDGKGMPKPLDLALFVRRFQREVKAPFPPAPVVRAMLAPLAWLATPQGPRRALRARHGRARPRAVATFRGVPGAVYSLGGVSSRPPPRPAGARAAGASWPASR